MSSRYLNILVIIFSFVSMICWGVTPLFVKLGLKDIEPHAGLAIGASATVIILFGWMIADGSFSKIGQISSTALIFLILDAVLSSFIGDLAYFFAIKHGQVSLVATILSCSPLVTVILCALFLNETITAAKIIGAVLIVAGIIFTLK